jgi:hypothetical protein
MGIEDRGSWKGWEYESANGLHMVMTKSHFFVDGETALCGVTIPQNVGVGAMDGECGRCRKSLDRLELQTETVSH